MGELGRCWVIMQTVICTSLATSSKIENASTEVTCIVGTLKFKTASYSHFCFVLCQGMEKGTAPESILKLLPSHPTGQMCAGSN